MNLNNFLNVLPVVLIFCLMIISIIKLTASQWDLYWFVSLQIYSWVTMKEIGFRNLTYKRYFYIDPMYMIFFACLKMRSTLEIFLST